MQNKSIKSKLPYPLFDSSKKTINDARILIPDYAGKISATTRMLQYLYGSYALTHTCTNISTILMEMGMACMTHQQILADVILCSGGTPIIGDNQRFWNGAYINYSITPLLLLRNNIELEKLSISNLEISITRLSNPSVIAIVERIIIDEELHIELLEQLITELD